MAFHPCSGVGLFLVLAALIFLIFAEIGQSSSSNIPRKLRFAYLDASGFGKGLAAASGQEGDLPQLYSAYPGANGTGIASIYEWGLWSYCEGPSTLGSFKPFCSSNTFSHRFTPLSSFLLDVPPTYITPINQVIPPSTFTDESYLSSSTHIAFYFIFVGLILAALAFTIGFGAHRYAYMVTAALAFIAAVLLAVGAIIWTVIVGKVKSGINGLSVIGGVPLGLSVGYGNGLWLLWAAVGALLLSILPFFFACCLGRTNRTTYY